MILFWDTPMYRSQEELIKNWSKKRELGFWWFMLRKGVGLGLTCGICLSMLILLDDYGLT